MTRITNQIENKGTNPFVFSLKNFESMTWVQPFSKSPRPANPRGKILINDDGAFSPQTHGTTVPSA